MNYTNNPNVWGGSVVETKLNFLGALRLRYALSDLKGVKGKVLEAGCGGGGFIAGIKDKRPDLECFGIDVSKEAIREAGKNFRTVAFKTASIYKLPFKDNYFDGVVVEDVVEHLENPRKAFEEIARVLKKGGVLTAYVPLEGVWYGLHLWLYKLGWRHKEKYAEHIQRFSVNDLRLMINKYYIKIERLHYGPHLLGQLLDVGTYFWAGLRGHYEPGMEANLKNPILLLIKNIFTTIINIESLIFSKIPAAGIYLKCRKK